MARSKGKSRSLDSLTPLEMEVMDIAWDLGKMTIRDVHEQISKVRYLPYTTISAVMKNLAKKNILKQSRNGKIYIYKVLVDRDTVARATIDSVISKILRGDTSPLVAYLAEKNSLPSPEEIEKLKSGK